MDKHYLLNIINQFEKTPQSLPEEVRTKLQELKLNLNSMSQDTFDLLSNGAVRVSPVEEKSTDQLDPMFQLRGLYSDLESSTLSGDVDPDLYRALIQLRGILDIPDRYWP